jgi:hypothetical protein
VEGNFGFGPHCVFIDGPGNFLDVSLFDCSTIDATAFLPLDSTLLEIDIYSPAVLLDHSIYLANEVATFYFTPNPFVTFRPAGVDGFNVFTNFAQLCAYIARVDSSNITTVANRVPAWTIVFDPAGGGTPTIPAGTYALPPTTTFASAVADGASSVILAAGVIFDPPPLHLIVDDIAVETANIATPTITLTTEMYLVVQGRFALIINGNVQPFASVTTTSTLTTDLRDTAQIASGGAGPLFTIDATSGIDLDMFDQSILTSIGVFGITPGGTVAVKIEAETSIDPSYAFVAGLTVTLKAKAEQVAYTPADLAKWSGVTPATVAVALDRIAAMIGPIP